jgi:hypothetical protein
MSQRDEAIRMPPISDVSEREGRLCRAWDEVMRDDKDNAFHIAHMIPHGLERLRVAMCIPDLHATSRTTLVSNELR